MSVHGGSAMIQANPFSDQICLTWCVSWLAILSLSSISFFCLNISFPPIYPRRLVRTLATLLFFLLANATFRSSRLSLQLQQCSPMRWARTGAIADLMLSEDRLEGRSGEGKQK
jgi:hypothetical protein